MEVSEQVVVIIWGKSKRGREIEKGEERGALCF